MRLPRVNRSAPADSGRHLRAAVVWGILALLLVAPLVSETPEASADQTDGPFFALARADGLSIEVLNPNTPLVSGGQAAFVSTTTAQAVLDSLGTSTAFASAPYPGDVVVTAPGLVAGAVGGLLPPQAPKLPPLPDYPLSVTSSHPLIPEKSLGEDPLPYRLEARSDESRSTGSATVAVASGDPSVGRVASAAAASRDDEGLVVSTARSAVEGLAFGDVLRIGRFSTEAKAERYPGGDVSRWSDVELAGVLVAGVPVKISEEGLYAAGTPTPLPGLEPLAPVLKAAGIEVEYMPARETDDGVTSATLVIQRQVEVPNLGLFTVIYRYGNVVTEASAVPGFSFPGPLANTPGGGGSTSIGTGTGGAPAVLGESVTDAGPSSLPQDRPVVRSPSQGEVHAISQGALDPTGSAEGFYLVLVAAGLAVLGGSELFQLVGVRLRFGPRTDTPW